MSNSKTDFEFNKNSKNICGKRIKSIRKNIYIDGVGMTQEDLAAKLQLRGGNFMRLTVSRIENGRREVSDYELVQLADALGVDVNTLVCGNMTVSEMTELIYKRIYSDGEYDDI